MRGSLSFPGGDPLVAEGTGPSFFSSAAEYVRPHT